MHYHKKDEMEYKSMKAPIVMYGESPMIIPVEHAKIVSAFLLIHKVRS